MPHSPRRGVAVLAWCALSMGMFSSWVSAQPSPALTVERAYAELLEVHSSTRALMEPVRDEGGVADWSAGTIAATLSTLRGLRQRHGALAEVSWDRSQRVDWLLVRSLLDGLEFRLRVSRPWARDPGHYVDRIQRLPFVQFPASGEDLQRLRDGLERVPALLASARAQLDDPAADYVTLALYNLTHHDGVGHGQAYRAEPPAGVIGWYEDLLARVAEDQAELVPQARKARDAVVQFHAWLDEHRAEWQGTAGVGRAQFDWYVRQVKLIPLNTDALLTLGEREYERLVAYLTLERHRNRHLPVLQPAQSAEEYEARIRAADEQIRAFIVERDIITVPPYVGELATNVPWMVRAQGRNFWEEIQYRDPRPDHVHAVIPGHRFDWLYAANQQDPIRSPYWEGARVEGWAVYLEEMFLNAGLLDELPRTRELFHIFGIKRAVRVRADIEMQQHRMSVEEATRYMVERVPFLDENVARVDAEIYLRRPPGYGMGYLIGMVQMEALLADRARQLGDDFELRAFHDEFLAAGRIPISLIRYEMTGHDDELRQLLPYVPLLATH
ncbi:MAG: DUF885 family protein [Pseudomonadota bacterium]